MKKFYLVFFASLMTALSASASTVTLIHDFQFTDLQHRGGEQGKIPGNISGRVVFSTDDNPSSTVDSSGGSLLSLEVFVDGTLYSNGAVPFGTSTDEADNAYLEVDIGDQVASRANDFRIQYSFLKSQTDPFVLTELTTINNYAFFRIGGALLGGSGTFTNFTTTPVPLPASGLVLTGSLGFLFGLVRRHKTHNLRAL